MNKNNFLLILILQSVFLFAFFLFSLMGVLMSPMLFDEGSSIGVWIIFLLVLLTPIMILSSIVSGWVLYFRKNYKYSMIIPGIFSIIGIFLFIFIFFI